MPIHGYFQAENAALAIAAVEAFLGGGQHRLMDDVVRVALADVASPGRLQVIEQNPLVLLDGAHNPHGAKALASALSNSFEARETVAVISMLEQKDLAGFLQNLDPAVTHYVVTQSSSDRALSAEVLAERISAEVGKGKVSVQVNFASALEQARGLLSDSTSGAVLVTGSLTLVGDAQAMIQREAELDG
jgi:dihydrofolate synthase/folylpolyglutamate synthase